MRLAAILVIVLATRCAWAQCPPQTVVGSDTAQYDRFGQSVSVNEDVIVVGAREAEQSYVYEWLDASASWTEVSILGPSQSSITPTHFGRTVAVEGDVIAVGAPSHNTSEGRVYVFEKSGSNWVETAALTSSVNPIITTQFGRCVAIDDERIFVGRIYGFPSARHAIHVFERNGAEWQETHTFAPTGETRRFGEAIAVDGNRALVGAPDGTFSNGSAFVFEYIGNEWVEQQELLVSGNEQIVGYRVALDGDTALVSAQYGAVASGSVYVFERDPQSGVWSEQDKFESASSGLLGSSTALSNEIAFISEATSDVAGDYAGAVHRFDRRGSTWTLSNTIYPNPGDGQTFVVAESRDLDPGLLAGLDQGHRRIDFDLDVVDDDFLKIGHIAVPTWFRALAIPAPLVTCVRRIRLRLQPPEVSRGCLLAVAQEPTRKAVLGDFLPAHTAIGFGIARRRPARGQIGDDLLAESLFLFLVGQKRLDVVHGIAEV